MVMADVRGPISYPNRRPRSSVVERGISSVSKKRSRPPPSPPPPPRRMSRIPLRFDSHDDDHENNDVVDDGRHGQDDNNDGDDPEEDEQQSGSEDERDSSWDDVWSLGGSESDANDVVEGAGDGEGQPAEEGDSDDDRPIAVVPRARTLVHPGSTSTAPPAAAAPPQSSEKEEEEDSSSVIRNVTVENSSAFDCTICYLPLKSPIFQCSVGHVVCSPCHDKLGQATRCHVCRTPTPGGYLRCNAMEQVVDSIRVPCPHAANGCAVTPAYHDRDAHTATCVHKPCHCPGEGCGFAGPVQTTLLEHFAAVHSWPCSTGTNGLVVDLRKGFNVVTVVNVGAATGTSEQHTFVLNVEQASPFGDAAITAFCIHPRNAGIAKLVLSCFGYGVSDSCSWYKLQSELKVMCTDLSNGLPGPSSCFRFLVPRSSAQEDQDKDIRVTVQHIPVD